MASASVMSHYFREVLLADGAHGDLILYLEHKSITSAARLASFCDDRTEVRDLLVNFCRTTANARGQATILIGLWCDAENETQERSKREAVGYTDTDMEVAFDPGLEVHFVKRFATSYKYSFSEHNCCGATSEADCDGRSTGETTPWSMSSQSALKESQAAQRPQRNSSWATQRS